jgi:hypothetical protein
MKKFFLVIVMFSFVCASHAQTQFTVPTPTMEEKYNGTTFILNNCILTLITVAKSEGMTVEELGKKCGDVFIPAWDENTGFEGFVDFALFAWTSFSDDVQIMEQSNEKVVITFSHLYKNLEEQGVLFGSSVEDYTTFFNAMNKVIASQFNLSFDMTWGEEGYKIVITK